MAYGYGPCIRMVTGKYAMFHKQIQDISYHVGFSIVVDMSSSISNGESSCSFFFAKRGIEVRTL
jgi:hypothetical protein